MVKEDKKIVDTPKTVDIANKKAVDLVGNLFATEEQSDLSKVVKQLLSEDDIKIKTELNQNQINAIAILTSIAEKYDIQAIKRLIDEFLKLQISKGRKSRMEIVEIMKAKFIKPESELSELMRSLR